MSSQTLFYLAFATIIALLVALFQYRYKSKKISGINKLLFPVLRFISVFALLLLLLNPKFEKVSYYNEKPSLVVAIDNSESVNYLKQSRAVENIVKGIKENDALNEKFKIDYYTFGKTVISNDSLAFNEQQTDVASVFKNSRQVYKSLNAPLVLITDGNQTLGNDYEFAAQKYGHPVFPVILGDTITYSDIKLQQLNVNKYAFLKNKFPIEVIATYNGNSSVNTELRISSGTSVLFKKALQFSKSNNSQVIQFTLPANSVGVKRYRASL